MDELYLHSVDISHRRLPQLMKLADSAEAFYRWVERVFQQTLGNKETLSRNLLDGQPRPTAQRDPGLLPAKGGRHGPAGPV